MNSYERFCFKLIGNRMKAKRSDYHDLRNDMMGARMQIPFEAYLATTYVSALISGLFCAVVAGLFTYLLKIPELIKYKGVLPAVIVSFSSYSMIIGTIIAVIVSFIIFGGTTYYVFLLYPGILAGERRRNIDATLPYAINYITAMSTAGITPAELFHLLGDSKIYGECAVEARYITREVELFGKDLVDALRICSSYTPSQKMKDFLQGSMASISSGANLTEYFRTKAEQYRHENHQNQKMFLETLGLISESYVTALVAGTLFIIILESVVSAISGSSSVYILYAVIYGIIPFGSLMFIITISSLTPEV